MHKVFGGLGLAMIAGGVISGVFAYFFLRGQDFLLALLARVVERPFEYRSLVAVLIGFALVAVGCLFGTLYVGIGQILGSFAKASRRGRPPGS